VGDLTLELDAVADYTPTLYDVKRYFCTHVPVGVDGKPRSILIGEERPAMTSTIYLLIMRGSVLLRAYSGTAKTLIIDAIHFLSDPERWYTIERGSGKNIWSQGRHIDKADIVEFPELQKSADNLDTIEVR